MEGVRDEPLAFSMTEGKARKQIMFRTVHFPGSCRQSGEDRLEGSLPVQSGWGEVRCVQSTWKWLAWLFIVSYLIPDREKVHSI